jgi:hypothetical protein
VGSCLTPPACLLGPSVNGNVVIILPGYRHGSVIFFTVDRRLMLQNVLALGIVRLFGFHANNSPCVEQHECGEHTKAVPVSSNSSVGTHLTGTAVRFLNIIGRNLVKREFNKEDKFVQNLSLAGSSL